MQVERDRFWELRVSGMPLLEITALLGLNGQTPNRWILERGGVRPRAAAARSVRYLTADERETIALMWHAGSSKTVIALATGRHPSTIGRELRRNTLRPAKAHQRAQYRAGSAERRAAERRKRPKAAKLSHALNPELHDYVQTWLTAKCSPEQITHRLVLDFPNRPEMRVSHETIYQAIYVQSRGALRRELAACLRTGRAVRRPKRRSAERRPRIPRELLISERPFEVEDRQVPGHWEGDLILGAWNASAIGTLVERTTRFCILLHLPGRHGAEEVSDALITAIRQLPDMLRGSLTWDQGIELTRHADITLATDLDIYFCDPHSPWQRGSNENTNGLLRQYFPKSTDLSVHSPEELRRVSEELNGRPRKTLGWRNPREALNELLLATTD